MSVLRPTILQSQINLQSPDRQSLNSSTVLVSRRRYFPPTLIRTPPLTNLGDPIVVGRGRDAALDRAEDGAVRVALAAGFGGGQGGLAGGEVDGQDRVQREGELDDPEQDDEEEREDQDEFDQGLAFLPAATTASAGSRVDG